MRRRKLGSTDLELSEITLGTWGLAAGSYGSVPRDRFVTVAKHALEVGVSTFDLAPMWGDGEAERVVGELLVGRRDDAQIITRAGVRIDEGRLSCGFTAEDLRADCEASLGRLATDRIDLWLLHNPPEEVLRLDDWREIAGRLMDEGKIRAFGVSVGNAAEARIALAQGAQAICIVHSVLDSALFEDLESEIAVAGAGVLARSTLLYGLLAGHWTEYRSFAPGDHRRDRWTTDALRVRVRQMRQLHFLTGGKAPNLASAGIRYVLNDETVTSAIIGARTASQIAMAAACAGDEPYLEEAKLARLGQILAAMGA